MNRPAAYGLVAMGLILTLVSMVDPPTGHGQRPQLRSNRGELGTRVTGERVTRQVEVLRLQREIDEIDSRVLRLERQAIASGGLPPYSIEEAEAALVLAETQLAATEKGLEEGEATETDVARDRLQLARAKSQLKLAKSSHADEKLSLESDLAHVERQLARETKDYEQMQRLVAKGYTSSDSLELKKLDVELALIAVQRAKKRLELYRAED